jgi:hypothetical protein
MFFRTGAYFLRVYEKSEQQVQLVKMYLILILN